MKKLIKLNKIELINNNNKKGFDWSPESKKCPK